MCPHWAGASTRWSGQGGARDGHQPSSSATLEVTTNTNHNIDCLPREEQHNTTQETVCQELQVAKVKVEENPNVTLTYLELLCHLIS